MKKIMTLGAMVLMLMCGVAQAQDCEYIVSFKSRNLDRIPPSKIDYFCRLSQNSFFVTNSVPTGATVYSISELKEISTQMHVPSNYVVNLDSLSLYRYDFARYQSMNENVYFLTEGSEYMYLGLRGYYAVREMTPDGDSNLDTEWLERGNQSNR